MRNRSKGLTLPELLPGTLLKRYKRFLADIKLESGELITAHCPNSGSMTSRSEPGRCVYVSVQDRPERKLKYTWEIIEMPTSLVGINTLVPNRLVYQSLMTGQIHGFDEYDTIKTEVRVGRHSRLDIMLSNVHGKQCYMEIKNCTLVDDGIAYFPDAITTRGRNHLIILEDLAAAGNRSVMFFLIQRMDAKFFRPADHVDPAYGKQLRKANASSVEIIIYDVKIDLQKICLGKRIPYQL